MSSKSVLGIAAGQIGYTEQPANSNKTKYGAEYGLDGQPWCVMFLWWCFRQAGESSAFFGGAKTASCGTLLKWYRDNGWTVPSSDAQPGDVVILNFHGTLDTEHCGIVESISGNTMYTIEGNTSVYGSQDNGGIVMRKARFQSQVVGVCRPQYKADPVTDYAGHWAEAAIEAVKAAGLMQGDPDGRFRPNDPVTRAELATVIARLEEKA